MPYRLDDFDFDLPEELIAQRPSAGRSDSRLLVPQAGTPADRRIADLPQLLRAGDLLVVNDTRVIKARFLGHKTSGGRVELLVERILGSHHALAQIRASKSPVAGSRLRLEERFDIDVTGRDGEFYAVALPADDPDSLWTHCEACGRLPLPPYITHAADGADEARYQTVFAREPGAVAAPTAGLHFDQTLFDALADAGIVRTALTLHVGAGTFQPVRVDDLSQHRMHAERFTIPPATVAAIAAARARGGRVVAVGTTSLRALEAATPPGESVPQPGDGETRLFILPGYRFRCVDLLLTNFHLPKSTLLMLVSAFAGIETIRAAYAHAIRQSYRFFSYGDAMLLERNPDAV
jgi:S-adenosylmethionine:tRNA ribosyltransferase-isomerase